MIIRKSELTPGKWSGGTTTELFIYPEGSDYATRDFDFRISTATVETDRSEFTHLPGYLRILCVLSGELKMEYLTDAGKTVTMELESLEQASFPGSLSITGFGQVTDFNIIYKPEYHASATIFHYEANEEVEWIIKDEHCFVWVVEGEVVTSSGIGKPEDLWVIGKNRSEVTHATVNTTIIHIRLSHDILRGKI